MNSPHAVRAFGSMPDGRAVSLFTLTNRHGMVVRVSDLGATLVGVETPDRNGQVAEITLGFDSAEGYMAPANPYFGATVGRFGNRVANGMFELEGRSHTLVTNNEPGGVPCHLHGGVKGFNKVLWRVADDATPGTIVFEYISPDGEEGYPGTLTARASYALNDANELEWCVTATTDRATIVNVVHHPYWNLSGDPAASIGGHLLTLAASRYLPTTSGLIPTGEIANVRGTPMDFLQPAAIGSRIDADHAALAAAGGYDHCWVLDNPEPAGLASAARVWEPMSGRAMSLRTNQPAIQFYSGNFLDGTVAGRSGSMYGRRTGLCLEPGNFPDAPNQADFPSPVLRPGQIYRHRVLYAFSME